MNSANCMIHWGKGILMNEYNSIAKPQSPLLVSQHSLSCLLPLYFDEQFHHEVLPFVSQADRWP